VAQRHMAEAVAAALDERVPLLVHAPTGVGKSLGYLTSNQQATWLVGAS